MSEEKQDNYLKYASMHSSRTLPQVCVDLFTTTCCTFSLKWTFSLEYENEHKLPFEEIVLKKMFAAAVIRC